MEYAIPEDHTARPAAARRPEQLAKDAEYAVPEERRIVLRARPKQAAKMLLPFAGILAAYAVHMLVPNVYPADYSAPYWSAVLLGCAGAYAPFYAAALFVAPIRKRLMRFSWLLCFIFLFIEAYDIATLKTGTLKLPFMPSPDKIIEQFVLNFSGILTAAGASLELLAAGFSIGLVLGLLSGVLSGCSHIASYWISPLLKIIGPVPGLVWLPVFVVGFNSSRVGSIAAVVIAVWFPLTLMLSNAIKNTDRDYVERAQTLGASKVHIILHVMIPAAVPALANALFMALAGSFGALSAAELCGVKSGLALAVKQMGTVANFGVVFAYVIAMVFIFSSLTMIMFAIRNWLLRWQKGLVRW